MYAWAPLPRTLSATFRDAAHPKVAVRRSAIADLVRWAGSDEARARCLACLLDLLESDSDLEVRSAAALALADAQAVESVGALVRLSGGAPPRVRQMALVAIGELAGRDDPGASEAVRSALGSEAPALRFQALIAAGRLLSPERLLPCVLEGFTDVEAKVRYIACRVAEERFFAAGACDADVVVTLQAGLQNLMSDADRDVALAAALVLASHGSSEGLDRIVDALNHGPGFSQPEDEQAAIELCGQLRVDAARPGLNARAFGRLWRAESPARFQARVALARLGDARAQRQIVKGLSSWSRTVRMQSVTAAGLARLQAARSRLLAMRGDERLADSVSVVEALAALDPE